MAMFAPNGLLGSSSLDKPIEHVPEVVPSFTLGGLLGPTSSSSAGALLVLRSPCHSDHLLGNQGPSKSFTPNGLLSDLTTSTMTLTFEASLILASGVGPTFTPNGLLSSSLGASFSSKTDHRTHKIHSGRRRRRPAHSRKSIRNSHSGIRLNLRLRAAVLRKRHHV
jgi:hypothetical protein